MNIETTTDASKNLTPPETAVPVENAIDYTIIIAGESLDVNAIYGQFKGKEKLTRQDIKDFMVNNKQGIPGLETLEKAIKKKKGDQKAKRIMGDVYDEIVDKMAERKWLLFHAELSPEFEMQLIKQWARAAV